MTRPMKFNRAAFRELRLDPGVQAFTKEVAEKVADLVESLDHLPDLHGRVELLLQATLPAEGPYLGHYVQLISAGSVVAVGQAYRDGRQRLYQVALRQAREHQPLDARAPAQDR